MKKDSLPKRLPVLEKVQAYYVSYWDGDGPSGKTVVIGYYLDRDAATVASHKSGYWGGNADVEEIELYTDGTSLYKVQSLGLPTDKHEKFHREMTEKITSKLTNAEIQFLKSNGL